MITKKQFLQPRNYGFMGGILGGVILKCIALFILPMSDAFLPIRALLVILLVFLTLRKTRTPKVILLQNLLFGLLITLLSVRMLELFYQTNMNISVYVIGSGFLIFFYFTARKLIANPYNL